MIFKTDSASLVGSWIFFCSFLVVMETQEIFLHEGSQEVVMLELWSDWYHTNICTFRVQRIN